MSWAAIQATDSRSTSACSLASSLSASWAAVILALSAIVVCPFVALLEQTDDHEARDGRTHIRPRGLATPRSATRPCSDESCACGGARTTASGKTSIPRTRALADTHARRAQSATRAWRGRGLVATASGRGRKPAVHVGDTPGRRGATAHQPSAVHASARSPAAVDRAGPPVVLWAPGYRQLQQYRRSPACRARRAKAVTSPRNGNTSAAVAPSQNSSVCTHR